MSNSSWATSTQSHYRVFISPHSSPNLAYFNSYSVSSGNAARLSKTSISLAGTTTPRLTFWMYHDTGYASSNDRVQAQVSTDDGASWTNVGGAISRYDASTGWKQHTVDLSAYAGQGNVRIGILGISAYGNDVHIDDIQVMSA